MAELKTDDVMTLVKTVASHARSIMQFIISFAVLLMIFGSVLSKYGFNIPSIPVEASAQDLVMWALVVALLTGRFTFGK